MEGAQARTVTINPSGKFRASLFSFLLSFSLLLLKKKKKKKKREREGRRKKKKKKKKKF